MKQNSNGFGRMFLSLCRLTARVSFFLVVSLMLTASGTPVLRIMPLGDSITRGDKSQETAGYRGPLWTNLLAAGYNVDYVGTATDYPGTISGMDINHEGHSGWRLDSSEGGNGIYEKLPGWFAAIDDPHVILLHLGTNDAGSNNLNDMSRTTRLLDRIFAAQPDTHVILTTLMWRSNTNAYAHIQTYNAALPSIVSAQQAKGQLITLLDMYAALGNDPANFDTDLLHPNATGYGLMANAWLGAIQDLYPDPDSFETANTPAVVQAEVSSAISSATTLKLQFNQTVDAITAANAANYTVSDATLGVPTVTVYPNNRSVRLVFAGEHRGKSFSLTVNGVKAGTNTKTVSQTLNFTVTEVMGAKNHVPMEEVNQYRLVYDLNIPASMPHMGWDSQGPYYAINRARQMAGCGIGRVAYWLETKDVNGKYDWVWVSLDTFTDDPAKIGFPTRRSGALFQQKVKNLRIWSNNATIVNRTGELVEEGNIEFWPNSYGKESRLGLPGANDNAYDFDDKIGGSLYGSMQIHDYQNGCTIFGINHWASGTPYFGVGTCATAGNADWTSVSTSYSYAKLQIYLMDDVKDVTPPEFLSVETRNGGTELVLSFSKPIAENQDFAGAISASGVAVRSVSRDSDEWSKVIARVSAPTGGVVSVTATGIRDDSPHRNAMAAPATLECSGTELPTEVVAHVSAAARDGYDLVYAYDLPVEGLFESIPADLPLGLAHSRYVTRADYPKAFDRVAYYMELVSSDGKTTNWVWTSFDAFTQDVKLLDFPSSLAVSTDSTVIDNLDVESNVSGIATGTGLSGGSVKVSYGANNAASTMRVMNGGYAVWAINNFRSYHSWVWYGIGVNNTGTGTADWLNMGSSTVSSTRFRRLYVMVRPTAAASVVDYPAPRDIVAHVPEAANYALLQDVTIDRTATYFYDAANYASHVLDNSAAFAGKTFSRVAYYMRYLYNNEEQWVWTSFDAPSQNLADIRVPDSITQDFASRVANMNVRSNVEGVRTGDSIQTGLVNFFGSCPNTGPYLGVPNATASYSTIDYTPRSGTYWGSFMVCNWATPQFILSFHGLTYKNEGGVAVGIGNNTLGGSNAPSWIFRYTVSQNTFTDVKLYVFVQEGPAPTAPEYLYTIAETGGKRACVLFSSAVPDTLLDPAAYAVYPADSTVMSVELSPQDSREVILTFAQPLRTGVTYMMSVPGNANGTRSEPCKTMNRQFVVPEETLPDFLNTANVSEIGDYELLYKFSIPSGNSSCGTYGAPYAIDKTRFGRGFDFDRVAYALHLVGTNNVEKWAWASMDAFTDNAAHIGIPSERRKPLWQCYVDNLIVRHGVSGGSAPDLTDGDYFQGNIEFFPGNYGQSLGLGIQGANASTYDFDDKPSSTTGSSYCSLQVHSYLAGQTVLAVDCLGGGGWSTYTPNLGIGNRPSTEAGYQGPDWTAWSYWNAPTFRTRDLYIFVRPSVRGSADVPVFTLQPQGIHVMIDEPVTLTAYAPNAVSYQWRKDGVAIEGATQTSYEVPTGGNLSATFDVIAYDAAGHSATSAGAEVQVSSGGTMMIIR